MAGMARRATPATVSEQLRAALLAAGEAGVTRYRIAKETGVSQAALSRFVHAKQNLDLASVDKLAAYLGMALTTLPPGGGRPRLDPNSKT